MLKKELDIFPTLDMALQHSKVEMASQLNFMFARLYDSSKAVEWKAAAALAMLVVLPKLLAAIDIIYFRYTSRSCSSPN